MTFSITRDRDSFEYLDIPITASVPLDDQTVEIALARSTAARTEDDWQPATWQGEVGTTRVARLEPFTAPGRGTFLIFARVTDSPEIPVIRAGRIFFR